MKYRAEFTNDEIVFILNNDSFLFFDPKIYKHLVRVYWNCQIHPNGNRTTIEPKNAHPYLNIKEVTREFEYDVLNIIKKYRLIPNAAKL